MSTDEPKITANERARRAPDAFGLSPTGALAFYGAITATVGTAYVLAGAPSWLVAPMVALAGACPVAARALRYHLDRRGAR